MHYFKFNVTDWISATSHLSAAEIGVYIRLITWYYDNERPIPLETQSVLRRLQLGSESEIVDLILEEFFEKTQKGWIHKKCDKLISEYKKTVTRNKKNGSKGGRPSKINGCNETQDKPSGFLVGSQDKPTGNPNQEPLTTNQELITNNKNTCTKLSAKDSVLDDSGHVISLPTNKYNTTGEEFAVTVDMVAEWRNAYPAVSVHDQLSKMRAWCFSNERNRKTKNGMKRFVNSWLAKAQNQSGGQSGQYQRPGQQKPDNSAAGRVRRNVEAELEKLARERERLGMPPRGGQGDHSMAMGPDDGHVRPQVDQQLRGRGGPEQGMASVFEGDCTRSD